MKNDLFELMSLPGLSLMDNGGGVGWMITDSPLSGACPGLDGLCGEKYLNELPWLQVDGFKMRDKMN
jgi:hypothetical protein